MQGIRDQNHCQLKLSGMGDEDDMAGLYNPLELTIKLLIWPSSRFALHIIQLSKHHGE